MTCRASNARGQMRAAGYGTLASHPHGTSVSHSKRRNPTSKPRDRRSPVYATRRSRRRRRKSSLIDGAGDDARDLSAHLAAYLAGDQTAEAWTLSPSA